MCVLVASVLVSVLGSVASAQTVFQAMMVLEGNESSTTSLANGNFFYSYIPSSQTTISVSETSLVKTVSNYLNNDSNGLATVTQIVYARQGGGASPSFVEREYRVINVTTITKKSGIWIAQTNELQSYPNNFSWTGPSIMGERKVDMGATRIIDKGTYVVMLTNNVYNDPALFKFYCSDNTGKQWIWRVRVGAHQSKVISFDAGGASAEAGHTVKWFKFITFPSVEPANFLVAPPPKIETVVNTETKGNEKL